ncbi:MAG: glycosyltransferase family 1 protein [Calditrichaeota bacterium]|nr:MAG: glycosyltransferase family 1 protein [Calditrichota bacterium]
MVISYFSYVWDINGISAGAAVKSNEFIAAIRRKNHKVYLEWRTNQPEFQTAVNGQIETNRKENIKTLLRKYYREPRSYLINIPRFFSEYSILQKQQPDILFSRHDYGNYANLLLSKMLGIPLVVEVDCPPTHEWSEFYAQDAVKFGHFSLKVELDYLKKADAVITQSTDLSQYYIEKGVPADKITMITNAADTNKIYPTTPDKDILEKYGLTGKIVVGWVGAGYAWTGIDVLIEAVYKVMPQFKNVCFMMIGTEKNMKFFREKFANTEFFDRIKLVGYVPNNEISRYLSCMDIAIAPYPPLDFFYASSMKLFEYMAAGLGIVATRIGQLAEVISEGENGFLYNPENAAELAEKITLLINDKKLRKKIGAAARKDAESEYNWDSVGEKMIKVFEKVLDK